MTQVRIHLLGAICLGFMIANAQAQVTIDVSKITCAQFRSYSITDPNNIALWLSGYYNGKRANTIINVESFKTNFEKLKDYCTTHPMTPVMEAARSSYCRRQITAFDGTLSRDHDSPIWAALIQPGLVIWN